MATSALNILIRVSRRRSRLERVYRKLQIGCKADGGKRHNGDWVGEALADGSKCQAEQDDRASQQEPLVGDRQCKGGQADGGCDHRDRHLLLQTVAAARKCEQEPVPAQAEGNAQKQR